MVVNLLQQFLVASVANRPHLGGYSLFRVVQPYRVVWFSYTGDVQANHTELSEAIASMFAWYRDAVKCYVYLSDVSARKRNNNGETNWTWESSFRSSRWFTRGWTLQELLAPAVVEFFSQEEELLGDKKLLKGLIHEITDIP